MITYNICITLRLLYSFLILKKCFFPFCMCLLDVFNFCQLKHGLELRFRSDIVPWLTLIIEGSIEDQFYSNQWRMCGWGVKYLDEGVSSNKMWAIGVDNLPRQMENQYSPSRNITNPIKLGSISGWSAPFHWATTTYDPQRRLWMLEEQNKDLYCSSVEGGAVDGLCSNCQREFWDRQCIGIINRSKT